MKQVTGKVMKNSGTGPGWLLICLVLGMPVFFLLIGTVFATDQFQNQANDSGAGPKIINIIQVAADPSGNVFVLTEDKSGLFCSRDNGRHWKQVALPKDLGLYSLSRNNAGWLYLCTSHGIFVSKDAGISWKKTDKSRAAFLVFSPDTRDYLVKLWGQGLYFRSATEGKTARMKQAPGLPGVPVQTAVFGPGNVPWAGVFGKGVFQLNRNTGRWEAKNSGLDNLKVLVLAKSPGGTLFAGTYGGGLYRWQSDQAAWHALDLGFLPAVVQSLAFDPSGAVYAGTLAHGIFYSQDQGKTFQQAGRELNLKNITTLAVTADRHLLAGVYADDLYALDTKRPSEMGPGKHREAFQPVCFAYTTKVQQVAMTDKGTWYAAVQGLPGIMASNSFGQRWTPVKLPFNTDKRFHFITRGEALIVGSLDHVPMIRHDQEKNWQKMASGLPDDSAYPGVRQFYQDQDGTIYTISGAAQGLFRLTSGDTWEKITVKTETHSTPEIFSMILCPENRAVISAFGQIWISREKFSSWRSYGFGQTETATYVDARMTIWSERMLSTFFLSQGSDQWKIARKIPATLYHDFVHIRGNDFLALFPGKGIDLVHWTGRDFKVYRRLLPNHVVRSAAAGGSAILAATDDGVFYSGDSGKTFKPAGFQ